MQKILMVGLALGLISGLAYGENGDGTRAVPQGGRGYGFVDADKDGINDNFVDLNGDGIDDNWVDADGDGVNDLRGTKDGAGRGRVAQSSNPRSPAQNQSSSPQSRGRKGGRR